MPEGTLTTNIGTLQTALTGIAGLLGEPGTNGSGLAGAATLVATSPTERVQRFRGQLGDQLSGTLSFDAEASISDVTEVLASLRTEAAAAPTEALDGFAEQIAGVSTVFGGDFAQRLQQALSTIRTISESVPENRTAIFSSLLDQILDVLASMEGPEAAQIQSWISSVQELHAVLMPLIEEAQSAEDPAAIAVEVFQRALDSTLEVFGFPDAKRLIDFLEGFANNMLPTETITAASTALASVSTAYSQTLEIADGDFVAFRTSAVAAAGAMEDLRAQLRPILGALHRTARVKIFQPDALGTFLREQMENAFSVQVNEAQKIDDPFNALFDRIDATIEQIDLSAIRTEVLGFFENVRDTIEQADISSVGEQLQEELDKVQVAIEDLQASVTDLLVRIQTFFGDLTSRFRTVAGSVGAFQPDGTFRFHVEQDLRDLLASASVAVGGDPADPSAPSVAGALDEFQTSVEQVLDQLNGLLTPVESSVTEVRDVAVSGINDFATFLQDLKMPALMTQLQNQVRAILDALAPIDFSAVVDPVVAQLEENIAKLREVDPESLNELLRAALATALDVIISIDFTAEISDPLKEQFDDIKAVPASAVEELQRRYEEAIAMLDALAPEQLLEALLATFDVIDDAVGSLDVATLLEPLDELHDELLQQPLAELRPSVLLQPTADSFQELISVFDDISGTALIAPINEQLNAFKEDLAGFDITGWVEDLLAAVEKAKQDLRDIRPSDILQPLVTDFERLEAELDRFQPSILFQPVVELATPLLALLETVQQEVVTELFEMFQAPLTVLDRLQPEALTRQIQGQLDAIIDAVEALGLPTRFNQIKGQYFDLRRALEADPSRASIAAEALDPQNQLGELVRVHDELIEALKVLKSNVELPDLAPLYEELRERLLGLLPPYARELLDPETFKRLMRLADPTRFLTELDARFEALKDKLLPIRPQDIAAELDATYETVLPLVESIDVEESLNQVQEIVDQIKDIAATIRVDFVAADIDSAVEDLRAVADALDISRLFAELDALHHEVELVVQSTLPSTVLSGLQTTLDKVQDIVSAVDPGAVLGPQLNQAWESVEDALGEVDFAKVLQPVVDKLDELETSFETALRDTENAFDEMLSAGRTALRGSGASVGVST